MTTKTDSYDLAAGGSRLFAMCMIIACHFMQYYGSALAWWFNVGVQIFFCISGFLYGQKEIPDGFAFVARNFKKILLDYYVYILFCLIPYGILRPELLSVQTLLNLLLCNVTLSGIDHLWFIPYILLCYLMTPLLNRLRLRMQKLRGAAKPALVVSLMLLLELLFDTFLPYFNPAWINCYAAAYFLGALKKRSGRLPGTATASITALALIFNAVQIGVDVFGLFVPQGIFTDYYYRFCNYAHVLLGISIFLLLHTALRGVRFARVPVLLRLSDRYAFDIYIAHQIYVQGTLNLQQLTPSPLLNGVIILVLILFSGILLGLMCSRLRKKSFFIRRKMAAPQ